MKILNGAVSACKADYQSTVFSISSQGFFVMQKLVPSLSAQASPQPEEDCFLDWGFLSAHHWNIPATEFRTGIVAGGYRIS